MKREKRESKDSLHVSFLDCTEKLTRICRVFSEEFRVERVADRPLTIEAFMQAYTLGECYGQGYIEKGKRLPSRANVEKTDKMFGSIKKKLYFCQVFMPVEGRSYIYQLSISSIN